VHFGKDGENIQNDRLGEEEKELACENDHAKRGEGGKRGNYEWQ